MLSENLIKTTQEYLSWDSNAVTRAEISDLLALAEKNDQKSVAELSDKMMKRLEFGTAGLRAPMGSGYNCLNDLVVIQTSQGLVSYLESQLGMEVLRERGIVVGYDHRATADNSINSYKFGCLLAAVCLFKGIKVYFYKGFVATPLVPFCVDTKNAAAGVMVTASHNPKQDDGYKVYYGNGAQIIPPHDAGIATCILKELAPWTQYVKDFHIEDVSNVTDCTKLREHKLCIDPTKEVGDLYIEQLASKMCRYPEDNAASTMNIVYTPMHGVGDAWTSRSFASMKLKPYIPVKEQILPDPEFPTVAFPNPEEGKGALALSFATADANDSKLVLANDPDADRLAIAEKQPNNEWKIFNGNQIGTILGHYSFTQYMKDHPNADKDNLYFVASTVSSKMLRAIAHKEGFHFEETLTGFKWMGNKTDELRKEGKTVLFSYEEAIGFCLGDLVKDKDGVCAAPVVAQLAIQLAKQGVSLSDYLDSLYHKYGYFVTQNHYVKCYDPATIDRIFARLRAEGKYWEKCGEYEISSIRDVTTGFDNAKPNNKGVLPVSPGSHMITYTFKNGCVATLRTSGTEPKLKYYCENFGAPGETFDQVKDALALQVKCIVDTMLQPEENKLEVPAC